MVICWKRLIYYMFFLRCSQNELTYGWDGLNIYMNQLNTARILTKSVLTLHHRRPAKTRTSYFPTVRNNSIIRHCWYSWFYKASNIFYFQPEQCSVTQSFSQVQFAANDMCRSLAILVKRLPRVSVYSWHEKLFRLTVFILLSFVLNYFFQHVYLSVFNCQTTLDLGKDINSGSEVKWIQTNFCCCCC